MKLERIHSGSNKQRQVSTSELLSNFVFGGYKPKRFVPGNNQSSGDMVYEVIDTGDGDEGSRVAGGLNHGSHVGHPHGVLSGPATEGVQTGTQRPYADGPKVALLAAQPIDKAAGKEVGQGIDNGEDGGDVAVMCVRPVELGRDEIFPGE